MTPAPIPTPAELELLARRAKALAARPVEVAAQAAADELLVVRAGGTRYALPLASLTTLVPVEQLATVPGAPPFFAGLAHLQGQTLSIVSLAVLLGHGPETIGAAVLTELGGELVGIGVEAYEGLRPFARLELQPAPRGLSDFAGQVVEGTLPGGVVVLNARQLLKQLDQGTQDDATTRPGV